ncbi:MAG: helix-turn-helix domain-containing protein [Lachnospiraceae bacterium]|nr:helix-turn-helix domain-containing protein [Lachnospiraceae bacterium]
MASLGENIRFLRIKHGYSQDYIAEQLGYKSFTTIQKWESGVSEPPVKKLKELSLLLNADMNDMANSDLTIEKNNICEKLSVTIPVLGRVAAGVPIEAVENIIDTEEITLEMAKTGEFFGLKIKGDSMEPRIYDGDVVIVRKQEDAESGDIVIALVNGNDAVCKRLTKYAGGIGLLSLNNRYEPMMFTEEDILSKPVKIIGKVIELRGKLG